MQDKPKNAVSPSLQSSDRCISNVTLDEGMVIRRSPEIEMERHRALSDLMMDNHFVLREYPDLKDMALHLSVRGREIILCLRDQEQNTLTHLTVSQSPFRRVIKDYFMICESFYNMAKKGQHAKMEALDMGRRGLHNEGAEILTKQLDDKVELNHQTARQLFTLICVLHIRVFTN